MKRRVSFSMGVPAAALTQLPRAAEPAPPSNRVHPAIGKFTFGTPETITPVRTRAYGPATTALGSLPAVDVCPVAVTAGVSGRGRLVRIPLEPNELVYGRGLQMQSFIQRGLKKKLRVNADPEIDSGDAHAPVPSCLTTRSWNRQEGAVERGGEHAGPRYEITGWRRLGTSG